MERLKGKAILVAGAGAIGSELANRYAQEGAGVVLGDINLDSAESAVEKIVKNKGSAVAVHLDGADEGSIRAAVGRCRETYGGLDGLHVNFAQFEVPADDIGVMEIALPMFDESMRVNVRGFLLCTRHALPEIIARGGGAILYTSSVAAYRGERTRVAYAMSKAAALALMRHVAVRYGPDGVRANAIAPGVIRRPNQEHIFGPKLINWATSLAQIKSRIGHPEDIAALSALLMSDEGSFITGQTINVDGGMVMRA
jgi:NAD(P)-dependent dehydrogenase (short-subunit alcohol dehydrogenase family)